jgi:hypothetical protein
MAAPTASNAVNTCIASTDIGAKYDGRLHDLGVDSLEIETLDPGSVDETRDAQIGGRGVSFKTR